MKKSSLLFLLMSCTLWGQQAHTGKVLLSPAQLQQDFDVLVQSLDEVHPALYRYTARLELNRLADSLRAHPLSDSLSVSEFHLEVRKYIAHIGCGHTVALPSQEWYERQKTGAQLLPFDVYLLGDKIFVKNSAPEDTVLQPGLEILSVNGRSAGQILADIRSIIPRDGWGKTLVDFKAEKAFRTYYLFLYGSSASYQIEYRNEKHEVKTLQTPASNKLKDPPEDDQMFNTVVSGSNASFGILKKDSTVGILDIDGFSRKGYKKFYRQAFSEAAKRNIQNLVIDLRGNGGGYFPNGNRLLKYLMPQPFSMDFERPAGKIPKNENLHMPFFSRLTKSGFKLFPDRDKQDSSRNYFIGYKPRKKYHWKHNTYVLTDGGTFSMGSYVATTLNAHCGATVVGTETGGGEEGSNAILLYLLTLPHSQVRIHVPYYHLDHGVNPELPGRGVLPDVETTYTVKDKLEGRDVEMEQIFKLTTLSKNDSL